MVDAEMNQCVLLHLSAGISGILYGQGSYVPSKGEVSCQATYLRRSEIRAAICAADRSQSPSSVTEQLILSHAHDVLNVGHDRDFHGIALFPPWWSINGQSPGKLRAF